jgi:hypothetical protein
MTIAAKYEDGVFEPLEDAKLTEGTAAFGMWADREDIPDGVTYVNRLREPRF